MQYQRFFLTMLLLIKVASSSKDSSESISRYYYENQSDSSKLEFQQKTPHQPRSPQTETNEIPLEFYQELNNITDMSEFIEHFVDKDSIDPKLGLQENLKRNVERANIVRPEPVGCQPVNTIVPLIPLGTTHEEISNLYTYWPACTFVTRCSDCCDTKKIGCQPVETEMVNFRVLKYVYGSRKIAGVEIIPIEKHLSCSVQCRTKEKDCKSFHVYRADLCSCVCKSANGSNIHEELAKCSAQNNKIWDDQNCQCLCRENFQCPPGAVFDESECKCVTTPSSLTPEERKRFYVKPTLVEPDNSTLYQV